MAEKIKQNILIYYSGGATGKTGFTFNISNVPFQPDTLIVKSIDYQDSNSVQTGLVIIYSDLVGNKPLVSFCNINKATTMLRKDVYHKFNIILQGTFQFTLMDAANDLAEIDGDLSIQLEFSKGYY